MSGTNLPINNLIPGTPEYEAYRQGFTGGLKQPAAALPWVMSQLMPTESIQAPFGGAISALYGGLGQTILPGMMDFADAPNSGAEDKTPSIPGAEKASKDYQELIERNRKLTGVDKLATNEDERFAQDVYGSGAAMAIPSPSGLFAKIPSVAALGAKIPSLISRPVQAVEHLMFPPGAAAAPAGMANAAIAGGLEATAKESDPADFYAQRAKDVANNLDAQSQSDLPVPPVPPDYKAPQGGARTLPFDTSSTPTPPPQDQTTPAYHTVDEQPGWWNSYPARIAGGAAVLAGAWFGLKHGGDILNPIIERFTGESRDVAAANAHITALDTGTALPQTGLASGKPVRGEMPLPGGGDRPTVRFATGIADSNLPVNKYIEATAPTQQAADAMKNAYGSTNNSGASLAIIGEQARTGISAIDSSPMMRWSDDLHFYNSLTDGEKQVFDAGIWRANELDTRNILKAQARQKLRADPNAIILPEDTRVEFKNESTQSLQQAVALMNANPRTQYLADRFVMWNRQLTQHMLDNGMISPEQKTYFDHVRPYHMPTIDEFGNIQTGIHPLDITPGSGRQYAPALAMNAKNQQYFTTYRRILENNRNRMLADNDLSNQYVNPNAAKVFTLVEHPKGYWQVDPRTGIPSVAKQMTPGEGGSGRTITVWRNGQPHVYEVNNTVFHSALTRSDAQVKFLIDSANKLRRLNQAGETGISAMLLNQRPFSIYHLMRSGFAIPTARSAQMLGGPVDLLTQLATGGRYRGYDPLFHIDAVVKGMQGAGAEAAKGLGDMLSMANHPVSQQLRKYLGNIWTDNAAKWLQGRYEASTIGEYHRYVPGGGGTMGEVTTPGASLTQSERLGTQRSTVSPIANIEPGALGDANWLSRLPGGSGLTASYVNFRSILRDMHRAIADGGNLAFYKFNRDFNPNVSPRTAARESMEILGDPTHAGSYDFMQKAGKVQPFLNAAIQDWRRIGQNFKNAPLAYTSAVGSILIGLAVARTLSAMMGGPDHVNHMENQLNATQSGSNAIIYNPNLPPEQHTELTLPIAWRIPNTYLTEMVTTALGTFQLHKGEPAWDRMVHTLADFFGHHVETHTDEAAMKALSAAVPLGVPPYMQAPLAFFGKGVREIPDAVARSWSQGTAFADNMITNLDDPSRIPGQEANSTFISNDDGRWVGNVLSTINSGFANAWNQAQSFVERLGSSPTVHDAIMSSLGDIQQRWMDNTPMLNSVWHNSVELQSNNPLRESVNNQLAALNRFPKTDDLTSIGYASPNSPNPIIVSGKNKYPEDPKMQEMLVVINGFKESLAPFTKEMYDADAELKAIKNSNFEAPNKRALINQMQGVLDDKVAEVDKQFRWLNHRLSEIAGGRIVHLNSIDMGKGVDQFHN